jgi:hypothetical protein
MMANSKAEAKKQGLAWWDEGAIVEVWVHVEPSDPETYRARCLTSGTFPKLEILQHDVDEPHPRYPDALLKGEYGIFRVVPAREHVTPNNEILVIVGNGRKHPVKVIRKGSDEVVKDGFASIEEAADWIQKYEDGEEYADDEVEFTL